MKRFFNKLTLLLLTLLLFGTGLLLDKGLAKLGVNTNSSAINSSRVQKAFVQQEQKLHGLLDQLQGALERQNYEQVFFADLSNKFINNTENFSLDRQHLENEGFVLLYYSQDTLKYWSSNVIPLNDLFSDVQLATRVFKLNHAFYSVVVRHKGNDTLVGMIRLGQRYPINNRYLPNGFNPKFALDKSVKISRYPIRDGVDIYNGKNEYVFSLFQESNSISDKPFYLLIVVLYALSFIGLLVYVNSLYVWLMRQSFKGKVLVMPIATVALGAFYLGFRYVMMTYDFPSIFYSLKLFNDPTFYSASTWRPSLGDFFVDVVVLFIFSTQIMLSMRFNPDYAESIRWKKFLSIPLTVILLGLIALVLGFIETSAKSLIYNSQISFELHRITKLDGYSLVAFVSIALLFASLIFIADRLIDFCSQIIELIQFVVIALVFGIILLPVLSYIGYRTEVFTFLFLIIILSSIAIIRFRAIPYHYYTYVYLTLWVSLYTIIFLTSNIEEKNRDIDKVKAMNLANERDAVAENILTEMEDQVNNDQRIQEYLKKPLINSERLYNYLNTTYFKGYMERYELIPNICVNNTEYPAASYFTHCDELFGNLVDTMGIPLKSSNYYYLSSTEGARYIGAITCTSVHDSVDNTLVFKLKPKPGFTGLSYPEVLLDETTLRNSYENYSYAKFKNGQLTSKYGDFSYNARMDSYFNSGKEFYFTEFNDYSHIFYNISPTEVIILSKPTSQLWNSIVAFSYIFVFFNIILAIFILLGHLPLKLNQIIFNFKTKLQLSMVSMLVLTFLLVGATVLIYNLNQSEQKHFDYISEKAQSVQDHFSFMLYNPDGKITTEAIKVNRETLAEQFSKFSSIFVTDINFYDLEGNLLVSSRPQIFNKKLLGEKMDMTAFYELAGNKKTKFIQREKIGQLGYLSAYLPFKNRQGEIVAYLNLPYFAKASSIQEETTGLWVAIVNIFVFLLLITLVLAVLISDKITHPLRLLQAQFTKIELGKTTEEIKYPKRDEIGSLVNEHNRMVKELALSTDLLAKTEREIAWREMAKQIAHEIKNPLTPMKLNIQFLQRAWLDQRDDFGSRLHRTVATLTGEIDKLSSIATEFSMFAKMPKANNVVLDIVGVVQHCTSLFENSEDAEVHFDDDQYEEEILVYADKEQMNRTFINLIKNGIQAVPNERFGQIKVWIEQEDELIRVVVEDNGTGISDELKDRLFQPSFTTKSSGMGLGLSMVKNIIEQANGKIWFETEMGVGTRFYVELSVYHYDKEEERD